MDKIPKSRRVGEICREILQTVARIIGLLSWGDLNFPNINWDYRSAKRLDGEGFCLAYSGKCYQSICR